MAAQYQSFSTLSYANLDTPALNSDYYSLRSTYYLDKKLTMGPLDELEYINKVSNVFGGASDSKNINSYNVGGEFFIDKLLVGGSYTYLNSNTDDVYDLQLGYLLSDDLLVKATALNNGFETAYYFSAAYNYQINDRDYIGFSYGTDDNLDSQTLSSKYFNALTTNTYFITELYYNYNDNMDNNLGARVSYYFDEGTSVAASYDDDDDYSLQAKYFINKNYAVSVGYSSNASTNNGYDYDLYSLNLIAQF
jgi:putative general porin